MSGDLALGPLGFGGYQFIITAAFKLLKAVIAELDHDG